MAGVDPREALIRLASERGESLASLSRLIGRNAAYLQQFVTRGSPRVLAEADRRLLAGYLGVSEALLGAPPPVAARISVKRVDAIASAGPGGLLDDDRAAGGVMIDAALLRRLGLRADDLTIVTARGDSMLPTIADGDEMLVNQADRKPGSSGGIFVARLDGAILVKRIMERDRRLILLSDNPAYPAIVGTGAEIIGRVVRLTRLLR